MSDFSEKATFGVADFAVLFVMMGLTMLVGIYYAIKDRKNETMDTYYFGGKNMSPIPVGFSISVTWISAITMVTFPVETYLYGLVNAWYCFAPILPNVIHCLYHIPIVHNLKLASIYEYFERRFNHQIRKLESFIMCCVMVFFMAITIYLPGLALSAVTPLSIPVTIIITGAVCTFYTSLGGMKAVIWVDTMQSVVMLAGMLAVLVKTVMLVGGVGNLYERLDRGKRTNFLTFDADPTLRNSFWTIIMGCGVTWSTPNQAIIQRYMSCRNTKKARQAAIISVFPSMIFLTIAILSGAAMYGYFANCDPLESEKIEKPDQMMPYLVLEIFQDLPGMAGVFVVAVFSGTLSTISSGINSIASMVMEDFVIPFKPKLSQAVKVTISKFIVCLFGASVTGFSMVFIQLDGTIFQIAYTFFGVAGGPLLGVFVLGMFLPWTNTKGAFIGQLAGTALTGWVAFSGYFYAKFHSGNDELPARVDGCVAMPSNLTDFNSQVLTTSPLHVTEPSDDSYTDRAFIATATNCYIEVKSETYGLETTLYAVSFLYYGTISLITTVISGTIGSFLTGANSASQADPILFVPLLSNPIFPSSLRNFFRFGVPEVGMNKNGYLSNGETDGLVAGNGTEMSIRAKFDEANI